MDRWLDRICAAISLLLFICLTIMTAVMVSLVLTRYLFSWSPSWSEETTRYLMVWMVMLGGAVLVLFDDHIALHILADRLGKRARMIQMILIRLVIASVCAVTAWKGYGFAVSMWTVFAPGLGIPMFWPTVAIPVSMTLALVFSLLLILRDARILPGGAPGFDIPRQSDFMDGSFKPAATDAEGEADVH